MANPNPEIWGDSSTWVYAPNAYGLNTTTAKIANCDKPKCANFGGTDNIYKSQLSRAISQGKMTINEYIDDTICPCGQAPDVSPFAKIAIFNENNDLSLTPRVYEITDSNINWFFADSSSNSNNNYYYHALYAREYDGLEHEQFAPKANTEHITNANTTFALMPYVYYGLKSLLLTIEVHIMPSDNDNPLSGTQWVKLDAWKNDYPAYVCIGMRLFARNCTSINNTSLDLIYNNTKDNPSSGYSAYLAITNPIPISNNGEETNTQLLSIFAGRTNNRCIMIFDVTPQIFNYNDYRRQRAVLPAWDYFTGQTVHTYYGILSDPVRYYYYKIPYNQANYDKMLSIAALFGCYFTPTNKYEFGIDMLDSDLYLTVLDDNGVAHGQYTKGTANATNPLYTKNSIRDIDYNPDTPPKPVDPNTYSNITGFNYITEGAAMTVRYVLDGANVDKLLSDLWTINASIAQGGDFEYFDGKIKDEYLTTNPIDCIVSLIRYPFNIPYQLQPLQSYVKLGKTEGSAKGWTTVYIANQINFQGKDIFPRFGNCFLDYEPYTTYELYVPFCGTTKIRAADILGHTLNLTMLIDLITGSCTAYVKADQLVIETLQGSCGVQQQISGTDTATMNANIYNGILAQKQAKTGMIAQAASALLPSNWINPVGYAAKGEQAETSYKQATFAIEHMETPVHSQGAASPLLGWIQEFDARLMIYYPEGDVIDGAIPPSFKPAPLAAFGHLKGFATVSPGTVGAFRSSNAAFISGDIIADEIPCTLSERNRIKSMFADGVYLPPL